MRRHFIRNIGLAISLMILSGCTGAREKLSHAAHDTLDFLQLNLFTPRDQILAQVGQQYVTRSEFMDYIDHLGPHSRARMTAMGDLHGTLETFNSQMRISEIARKAGLQHSAAYRNQLANYKKQLLATLYLHQLESTITEKDVTAYYNAHLAQFSTAQVRYTRLIVGSAVFAQRARSLLASGKPLATVLKTLRMPARFLIDRTENAVASLDKMDPMEKQTLLSLPAGKISNVIKDGDTYKLLRRESEIQQLPQPLETVRESVLFKIESQKVDALFDKSELHSQLVVNEPLLKSIPLPPKDRTADEQASTPAHPRT